MRLLSWFPHVSSMDSNASERARAHPVARGEERSSRLLAAADPHQGWGWLGDQPVDTSGQ